MIKAKLGDRLDAALRFALPFLFRHPINPNLLSSIGAILSVVSGLAFARGHPVGGALLIMFGGVFDLIDGIVAREHGLSTRFGAFLDSTLDRVSDLAIFLGIMVYFSERGDTATVVLTGVALSASVLTSYVKARAEHFVPSLRGGVLERGERILLLALGALTGFLVPALWLIAVLGSATVVQRFVATYRELSQLESESPPLAAAHGAAGSDLGEENP